MEEARLAQIHATALLEGDVELAPDVVVGPWCRLRGPIAIGAGTRLVASVHLDGPLRLGARNWLFPFATLGQAPQDLGFDPDEPGAGLVVGDGNVFRESASVHRATARDEPTRVGDANYFMVNTHAGHDCRIGSRCVFANGTLLAGHVEVGDGVVTGGNVAVHQHCRIGRGALISGTMGLNKDLPPFFTLTGGNIAGSINLVGMRRSGMPSAEIDDARWVFKVLYRKGLSPKRAQEELATRADRPIVAEYLAFLASSKRGVVPGIGEARRGTA
ncbi:MAG TPA: acyl-ACP--UDP-N-acetylglucosamine O-acyltransferase [Myxococcota bacterium]|nr:acyl-ACP--UDP-N-acetylglucosamine O-acyltransferase [Myxococcota bacterium]